MPDPAPSPAIRRKLAVSGQSAVSRPECGGASRVVQAAVAPSDGANGLADAVVLRSTLDGRPTVRDRPTVGDRSTVHDGRPVDGQPTPDRVSSSADATVRDVRVFPLEPAVGSSRRTVAQDLRFPHAR